MHLKVRSCRGRSARRGKKGAPQGRALTKVLLLELAGQVALDEGGLAVDTSGRECSASVPGRVGRRGVEVRPPSDSKTSRSAALLTLRCAESSARTDRVTDEDELESRARASFLLRRRRRERDRASARGGNGALGTQAPGERPDAGRCFKPRRRITRRRRAVRDAPGLTLLKDARAHLIPLRVLFACLARVPRTPGRSSSSRFLGLQVPKNFGFQSSHQAHAGLGGGVGGLRVKKRMGASLGKKVLGHLTGFFAESLEPFVGEHFTAKESSQPLNPSAGICWKTRASPTSRPCRTPFPRGRPASTTPKLRRANMWSASIAASCGGVAATRAGGSARGG